MDGFHSRREVNGLNGLDVLRIPQSRAQSSGVASLALFLPSQSLRMSICSLL